MQTPRQYRILICPLDWGLGHATRCIPLIRELKKSGARVILAAGGPQLDLLRAEFPEDEWIFFPGYRVSYGSRTGAGTSILLAAPRLLYNIVKEHFTLKSLIRKNHIDGLISDNRYGLWNRRIPSVFITHQLNIIAPPPLRFTESFLRTFTRFFAEKFDECWIPDSHGEENLSGRLSHGHPLPENAVYTGILSRLNSEKSFSYQNSYDVVALVSGPEPQRTIFENILLGQLPVKGKKCLLLRGIPGETTIVNLRENLDIAGHLSAGQLQNILTNNPFVICRSGYSTLMDLAFTGNKALLIPTPGQTEQEYLAKYLVKKGYYLSADQKSVNLEDAFLKAGNSANLFPLSPGPEYPAFIKGFLSRVMKSGSN